MSKDNFIFYASFWEAIKEVPRDIQGEVLTAIIEYGLYGETTEHLKPVAKAMFTLIKPQLDANKTRYENGKKGGKYGHLGGRPKKKNNPKETPKKPLNNPKETPKEKEKEKEKDYKKTTTNVVVKKENDLSFVSEEFKPVMQEWLSYKKERRESYKNERSLKALYEKLLKLSGGSAEKALQIINQSFASNYAGLFELKTEKHETNQRNYETRAERIRRESEEFKDSIVRKYASG